MSTLYNHGAGPQVSGKGSEDWQLLEEVGTCVPLRILGSLDLTFQPFAYDKEMGHCSLSSVSASELIGGEVKWLSGWRVRIRFPILAAVGALPGGFGPGR